MKNMRRLVMLAVTCGLTIALMSTAVEARGRALQPMCFQMAPFVDVVQITPMLVDHDQWFLTLDVVWVGQLPGEPPSYRLVGGGTAPYNLSESLWPLDITLQHPTPAIYFGNHSICRLVATIDETLQGPWAEDCIGNTAGAFYVWGATMRPIACGADALSVAEFMATFGEVPKLAGAK
jgi:hypothetical protein